MSLLLGLGIVLAASDLAASDPIVVVAGALATVITALTAQNTREVRSIAALSPAFVGDQIDVICEDIGVDGVKIGMLFEAKIIEVVASRLKHHKIKKIIPTINNPLRRNIDSF